MATMVKSFAIDGINGYSVEIETTILQGQPMLTIIGLGDLAVKESGERIQAALDTCGFDFPKRRIIVNLAPGDKKKRGSHFDLPIAISLLQQNETIDVKNIHDYGMIGELSLNGDLRYCNGILPMVIAAKQYGIKKMIVPYENLKEAKLVHGVDIFGFQNLRQVVKYMEGKGLPQICEHEIINEEVDLEKSYMDFSDVRGQNELIESVVLAVAGGHNMLMIGEPGCGKTMIAQRIPSIMPEMTEEEALEVTKIYSISGKLREGKHLLKKRPFRAPHHNVSMNAIIGGGVNALPGEVSLAHNGVLFLDEMTEFSRKTLDSLRQPIEDKHVLISRVNSTHTFPANFMFVAAMNPCPCGYYPNAKCRCTDYEIIKYRGRVSGPIMDRIDIQKEVHPVDFFEMEDSKKTFSSEELREQVKRAREIQQRRFAKIDGVNANAQMTTTMIQEYCKLDDECLEILKTNCQKHAYSARTIHKLLKLARTSADLDASDNIRKQDILRVLSCRDLDKSNSEMMVVE